MKTKLLFITSVILILSAISIYIFIGNNNPKKIFKPDDAGTLITKESQKWLFDRLKDPNTGKIPDNIKSLENQFIKNRFGVASKSKYRNVLLSDNVWQRRGPYEVGGRTRAFAYDIRNEDILIAGGVSSGMWKSIDAGASWTKTSIPSQLHSVSCLVQDTRTGKEDNWYYGTGEYWGNSADISGDGIYRSVDNGKSWNVIPSTSTNKPQSWENTFDYIWNMAVDPKAPLNQDVLLAATVSSGIFRTTDGGNKWSVVLGGSSKAAFTDIAVTSKGIFYATLSYTTNQQRGIFRSTDGINWTNITPANFPANYKRVVIGIAPSDENQVYIVGDTPGSGKKTMNSQGDTLWHNFWKYTYKSGDGAGVGGIWEDRSQNLPQPVPTRGQMNSQSSYNLVLKVKPDNPDVVILGAVVLYRTDDGFKTPDFKWIGGTCPDNTCDYDYRYTNHHSDLHSIFFSKSDYNVLYTGSDGGVHKTLNCMTDRPEWISLNNGYYSTQFYSIGISHGTENSEKVIGGLQDNGTLLTRNNNLMEPWTNPLKADGFYCAIPDGGNYYYSSQNSTYQPKIQIYRVVQDETGKNTISTRIDPAGGLDFIWNTPFILDPNNNNIMYLAGGKMVWRNNNLSEIPFVNSKDSISKNWDSLSKTRTDQSYIDPTSERITAIGASNKPANVVVYGTSNGRVYKILNANQGNPEPILINGQNFPGGYVSSIAFNPDNADEIYVSFSNYGILSIFRTENSGINWLPISGNLEEFPSGVGSGPAVNWVEVLKTNNNKYVYFAGTSAGLFSTAFINGPNTVWRQEAIDEIGNMVVDMIDVRHSDQYVAVATHGTGIFTTHYSGFPALPSATQLVSPANNTKYVSTQIELEWKKINDAVFYDVELSADPEFKTNVTRFEGLKDSITIAAALNQGRIKYYWRVRTVNAGGASEFTETWSFITAVNPPTLIFPEHNSQDAKTSLTLQWSAVEGATSYHLQLNKGFNIQKPIIDTIVYGNNCDIANLVKNSNYVWRVSSIEGTNEGVFSETFRFATRNPDNVPYKSDVSVNLKISPNPVNNIGRLDFNVNNPEHIQIFVYDMKGRIVDKIYDRQILPGSYFLEFNTSKLSSGSYICLLKADNFNNRILFTISK
jgi:hypothetical protein